MLDTSSGRDQVPPERNKGGFPDGQKARPILYFRLSPVRVSCVSSILIGRLCFLGFRSLYKFTGTDASIFYPL